MASTCTHLPDDLGPPTPGGDGCQDCIAAGRRNWLHLRLCQTCGHVGCCDHSPGRHATAHAHASRHPLIRSYEPGENWWWCYTDSLFFEITDAPDSPSHP